ncbi:hypothetical protein Gotur_006347 [Gossypium turneri]
MTALLLPRFGTTCKSHGQLISLEYLSKTERLLGRILGAECWRPPEGTMLKVNYDAAFNVHSMRSCTGLMFRDRLGRVIGSHLVLIAHAPSALTVEALACLHAVRLAVDLDLQEVVKAMTFRRCLFVHIPRKGNSFAHLLATTGLCGGVCSSLSRVIPNFAYLTVEPTPHTQTGSTLISSPTAGFWFLCCFFDPLLVLVLCSSAGAGSLFLCRCFVPLLHHW